ncbi:MAG: metallophosphoesterase [Clostridia bacterium]|nr:metallophosphoesterase [Clostridia bacterium]
MQIFSFIMALIMTLVPFVGRDAKNPDEALLNVSIISDTHLDARFPGGKLNLERGLRDMNKFDNDAVVVVGDLTNYGDEASVKYFYDIMRDTCDAENWVVATGNHEIGHPEEFTNEEARQNFIKYHNEYTGQGIENAYYSMDVDGYTFIVLCDQSEDNWDSCDIYEDQVAFLDAELARGTAEGKPVFVVCHVPVEGANGQDIIYEDGGLDEYSDVVKSTLEKYENVFFISGHVHTGINGYISKELFDVSCVETENGVTYVNLPTYGIVNRYGIPWNGMGFQMEVYEDEVIFRARKFNTSRWYGFYEFAIDLV